MQLSELPVVQSPVNSAAMVAYTGESLQVLRRALAGGAVQLSQPAPIREMRRKAASPPPT